MQHSGQSQQVRVETKRPQKISRIMRQAGTLSHPTGVAGYTQLNTRCNRNHWPRHNGCHVTIKSHRPGHMAKCRKLSRTIP